METAITDELTEYGIVHMVPILQAEGLEFVMQKIQEMHPARFLEIGTAIGRTSITAALSDPAMQVVTIEKNPEMAVVARKNIEEAGLTGQIQLIEGDALETEVPAGPYDLIFIDAAKGQYRRFFEKYSPLLAADGLILSDNMNFHGLVEHPERTHNRHTKGLIRRIRAYREFLETHPDFVTEFAEQGDGIALTRRKKHA